MSLRNSSGAAAMLAGLLASSEDQRTGLPVHSRLDWAGGLWELGQGSRRPGGGRSDAPQARHGELHLPQVLAAAHVQAGQLMQGQSHLLQGHQQ